MNGTSQDATTLLVRVENLERQNRLMRSCLMFGLLFGTGSVLLAANARDNATTIEATQIVLRDSDGKKRVVLGEVEHPSREGSRHGVFVYDAEGSVCVNLSAEDGKGGLYLEEHGKVRLSLANGKQHYAGLIVLAQAGQSEKGQMCFFFTDEGKPAFALNDSNNKTRVMMMLDKGEKPYLLLQDENQKAFFSESQP